MTTRIEIDPSALYLLWAGEGVISEDNPGIFSVKGGGQAYFGGGLRSEVIRTAVQNPVYSQNATVQTDPVDMPPGSKRVVASLYYENSGYRSTPLTGNPYCQVFLDYAYGINSTTWTALTNFPVNGTITNTPSGSGYQTRISMQNAVTYTHIDNRVGRFVYRASIMFASGPWPVTIGSSKGKQRLGLQVVSLN